MTVLGTLHFGLTVSDLDRSADWYCNVIGLREIHRQVGDNDYTRALVGIDNAALRVAQLAMPEENTLWPSSHCLELIEYTRAKGGSVKPQPNDVGATHVAFVVSDIDEVFERVHASGVDLRNPPVMVTEGVNRGSRACYLHDPDGHTVELMQYGSEREAQLRRADLPTA
jgi:lactoylglutathione lyase